ncbi:MAG TPA: hypothetical protein VJK51_00045 [Candidatus Nanoarchaeia archaeon]|nr:hypothetical protein [Candidatus Nanoarchaeia archaeon]
MRRGVVFLVGILVVFILLGSFTFAEEEVGDGTTNAVTEEAGTVAEDSSATTISESSIDGESSSEVTKLDEEYKNAELEKGSGITPDSGLYFIEDSILSKFRGDLENREKKVAEIRKMIEEGDIDSAKKALERYNEYANDLEREVDPEDRDEARRSAAAIRNSLKEIESEIPEDRRKEFVHDVLDKEGKIVTAVEIAGKIRALCEELSGLDPLEFSRVCSIDTESDAPEWRTKLDKKLTAEQREEAKKFRKIMSECFKTAGQECKCEEIPFPEFADTCSVAAPLATACEIKGDEAACEKMDNLKMPELPPHLQDIMDALEDDVGEERFDLHIPKECQEAGATDRNGCFKVMFRLNAPEECAEALDRGEISISNEREAREKCEEIMFRENAPEECIKAGLKDPKECGRFMFRLNAPEECVDAGLTGENRQDHKKCEEIMKRSNGEKGKGSEFGQQGGFGGNCKEIKNQEERLKCYDGATQNVRSFDERFRETKEREKQCAESCLSKGEAWDFSNGQCSCRAGNEERYDFDQKREEEFRPPERREFDRESGNWPQPPSGGFQPPQCQPGQYPVCDQNGCRCEGQSVAPTPPPSGTSEGQLPPPEQQPVVPPSDQSTVPTEESTPAPAPSAEPAPTPAPVESASAPTTGSAITGNAFLEYYYTP